MKTALASPQKRIRRTPADLRAEALAAARRLIVEGSGEALTMRAVADAIGVTYPNLSHHFGSAAGLHGAVAEELVRELLEAVRAIGAEAGAPLKDPARLVDVTMDLLDRQGLGRLMSWLARSNDPGLTFRIRKLIEDHVARAEVKYGDRAELARTLIPQVALILTLTAYAEASVGPMLGEALGLSAEQRREVIAKALAGMRGVLTEA